MDFGKYAVIAPYKHEFEMEPDWYWMIRPSISEDELAMAKFYQSKSKILDGKEGDSQIIRPHWIEIMYREIATLFAGTNIPKDPNKPIKDGGEPILKENASIDEVEVVLRKMPEKMVEEIWVALGKAVPFWGPNITSPKEEEDQKEKTGTKS
jgi:hypothetical protein